MSNVKEAYSQWSQQYDTNINLTRDVEAMALQTVLGNLNATSILEVGCGTGKNTSYLCTKAHTVVAVDLTAEMLAIARAKVPDNHVTFVQADINQEWTFTPQQFDLITFSLVLEHIEDLNFIFEQARKKLQPGGLVYVGELHPFKQYNGSKARFDTAAGRTIVDCYTHHTSDFVQAAKRHQFQMLDLQEFFDDHHNGIPRILSLLFVAV